jgi:hypothetical protein
LQLRPLILNYEGIEECHTVACIINNKLTFCNFYDQ